MFLWKSDIFITANNRNNNITCLFYCLHERKNKWKTLKS